MDLEKLKKFVQFAKDSGVAELKYETEAEKFSVTLPGESYSSQLMGLPQLVSPVSPNVGENTNSRLEEKDENIFEITSPFVGTFYRSPSPEAASFSKPGDRVSPGKVLCIIEAMKIMNEIEADISGEVIEVCVENENYVEFGQVLFKIRR
jgi:acetyl-CoA carboxylase biotin carboxyl carrier protein